MGRILESKQALDFIWRLKKSYWNPIKQNKKNNVGVIWISLEICSNQRGLNQLKRKQWLSSISTKVESVLIEVLNQLAIKLFFSKKRLYQSKNFLIN